MNVDARQAARERAADGVAPRHEVVILKWGWPRASDCGKDIDPSERQRRYRARRRLARAAS